MDQVSIELPEYLSHKKVRAVKIGIIKQSPATDIADGGTWQLIPADGRFETITVSHAWYLKHTPEEGGYFVAYVDGYSSYSPVGAFESGYVPLEVTDIQLHDVQVAHKFQDPDFARTLVLAKRRRDWTEEKTLQLMALYWELSLTRMRKDDRAGARTTSLNDVLLAFL